jgi:putative ABC transport system substrate-binding protein
MCYVLDVDEVFPSGGSMRRRDFVAGAFIATAWGAAGPTSAQNKPRTPRIAIVAVATKIEDITINGVRAFNGYFSELKRLGYVEGTNLLVERYSALGQIDRFQDIAQTAVARAPDVLVTWSNEPAGLPPEDHPERTAIARLS